MKLIRTKEGQLALQLRAYEKILLSQVLKLYPLIPPSHSRLSRSSKDAFLAERQKDLDEALAEQRRGAKQEIQRLLSSPERFQKSSSGYRLPLSPEQRELLLQVLNDIRVGCWLQLGSPEEMNRSTFDATNENAPLVLAMDACALFQMALINRA